MMEKMHKRLLWGGHGIAGVATAVEWELEVLNVVVKRVVAAMTEVMVLAAVATDAVGVEQNVADVQELVAAARAQQEEMWRAHSSWRSLQGLCEWWWWVSMRWGMTRNVAGMAMDELISLLAYWRLWSRWRYSPPRKKQEGARGARVVEHSS